MNTYNKKHKDSLFRLIFNDKKELLELYNAINKSSYTNYEDLIITTLEDAVYMHNKNDLSFLLYSEINLYEHQSTYNPNMPLRGLLYLAEIYSAYVNSTGYDIYSEQRIELPLPQYIIFYNGTRNEEAVRTLRLSDSFILSADKKPCLECEAIQLNINSGYNKDLMVKCRKLYEYSEFIHTIRSFRSNGTGWQEAIDSAVDYCINHDILKDFLIKNKAEVRKVILYEYDEALHMKTERRLGHEEGLKAGRNEQLVTSVERIMSVLSISLQEACDIIGTTKDAYYEAKSCPIDKTYSYY